ncbi:MAG: Uma2 family endonuclease, partial [Planctomycetes bacterium]|nr:Uma2 family endonuclease [Planctomycetota bacterium]
MARPIRRTTPHIQKRTIPLPTPTKKLAWEDYAALPDDGTRYEVLDGEVVVSPSAGSPHQGLQAALLYELFDRIQRPRRGKVFTDLDCELLRHDIVRPDLLVVLPAHYDRILPTRIAGTPDLAIEILSKATAARDRNEKRRRYEAAGTPELWLVDGD